MAQKLTDTIVKMFAPPAKGNRIEYDTDVKGFGCRVTAAGARSFILNYRTRAGRERRYTIGAYPDWKASAAREEAKELKKRIDVGHDPLAEAEADRNAKTDVTLIDPQSVLDRVAAMPIATWRYKTETDQVHLGPMAQDFRAAFGLGADDKHIATIDEGGVALAAIQGLNAKLEAVVAQQAQELAQQSHDLAEIKAQLAAIVATH